MADDILDRVDQTLDGVTDGPWTWTHGMDARAMVFGPDNLVVKLEGYADAKFIAAARTLVPELVDALRAARAENERLRTHLAAVPSAIRAYAGGELDGYSYHGDGSAIEALRRLSEHAENIRDYAGTRGDNTMTDKATQIIADALVENLFKRFAEAPPWGSPDEIVAAMRQEAEHILAALQAARIELVELPEPVHGPDGGGQYEWQPTVGTVTATPNDTGSWSIWDEGNEMSPDDARALAAALLAAAHTAETQHTAQER